MFGNKRKAREWGKVGMTDEIGKTGEAEESGDVTNSGQADMACR